nr:RNA-dependent RNA polymerase [Botrytis cinerea mycotymovirus 1]
MVEPKTSLRPPGLRRRPPARRVKPSNAKTRVAPGPHVQVGITSQKMPSTFSLSHLSVNTLLSPPTLIDAERSSEGPSVQRSALRPSGKVTRLPRKLSLTGGRKTNLAAANASKRRRVSIKTQHGSNAALSVYKTPTSRLPAGCEIWEEGGPFASNSKPAPWSYSVTPACKRLGDTITESYMEPAPVSIRYPERHNPASSRTKRVRFMDLAPANPYLVLPFEGSRTRVDDQPTKRLKQHRRKASLNVALQSGIGPCKTDSTSANYRSGKPSFDIELLADAIECSWSDPSYVKTMSDRLSGRDTSSHQLPTDSAVELSDASGSSSINSDKPNLTLLNTDLRSYGSSFSEHDDECALADGYCYLEFFPKHLQAEVASKLLAEPTLNRLVEVMTDYSDEYRYDLHDMVDEPFPDITTVLVFEEAYMQSSFAVNRLMAEHMNDGYLHSFEPDKLATDFYRAVAYGLRLVLETNAPGSDLGPLLAMVYTFRHGPFHELISYLGGLDPHEFMNFLRFLQDVCSFCPDRHSVVVGSGTKQLLGAFNGTIHNDSVLQNLVPAANHALALDARLGNYEMPVHISDCLSSAGVPTPAYPTMKHAHPGHKRLENYLYQVAWPALIGQDSVTVAFCKQKKFDVIQQYNPKFKELVNCDLTHKDLSRYGPTVLPEVLNNDTLLLYDAGHFLTDSSIAALFVRYPNLQYIYAGSIIPAETKEHCASAYPGFYTLEYCGTEIVYHLEDDPAGSYRQPLDAHKLLNPSRVSVVSPTQTVCWQSSVLGSYMAHHLLLFSRKFSQVPPETFTYKVPRCIRLPQPFLRRRFDARLGHTVVFTEAYSMGRIYKANLKKNNPEDTVSKVRSMMSQPKYAGLPETAWEEMRLVWDAVNQIGLFDPRYLNLTSGFMSSVKVAIMDYFTPDRSARTDLMVDLLLRGMHYLLPNWLSFPMLMGELVYALQNHQAAHASATIVILIGGLASPFFAACWTVFGLGRLAYSAYYSSKVSKVDYLLDSATARPWVITFPPRTAKYHQRNFHLDQPFLQPKPSFLSVPLFSDKLCSFCPNKVHKATLVCLDCGTCPEHKVYDDSLTRPRPCCVLAAEHQKRHDEIVDGSKNLGEQTEAEDASGEESDSGPPQTKTRVPVFTSPCGLTTPAYGHAFPSGSPTEVNFDGPPVVRLPVPDPQRNHAVPSASPTEVDFSGPPVVRLPGSTPDAPQVADTVSDDEISPNDSASVLDFGPIETSTNAHLDCRCPQHSGDFGASNERWARCKSGYGLWTSAPDDTQCHICVDVLPQEVAIYTISGQPHTDIYNALHPNLRITPGLVDAITPNTCALNAFASAVGVSQDVVWSSVKDYLGPTASVNLLPSPGFDERFFAVACIRFRCCAKLLNVPQGVPGRVGIKDTNCLGFNFTVVGGIPHWESVARPPRPLANLAKPSPSQPDSFMRLLASFNASSRTPLHLNFKRARINKSRASGLISDIKKGYTGTIKANEGKIFVNAFSARLDSLVDNYDSSRSVQVATVLGAPGCGKSAPLQDFLNLNPAFCKDFEVGVIVPRVKMREDWVGKINAYDSKMMVSTWETAMVRSRPVIVIDEISLFPPGYVDLLCVLYPGIKRVIILGDHCQCRFHSTHPDSGLSNTLNEAVYWAQKCGSQYLLQFHRAPQLLANFFNVPTSNPAKGSVVFRTLLNHKDPVLVASDVECAGLLQAGFKAFTFQQAQSRSFPRVQIRYTNVVQSLMETTTLVSGILRCSDTLILVADSMRHGSDPNSHHIVGKLLKFSSVFTNDPSSFGPADMAYTHLFRSELSGLTLVGFSQEEAVVLRAKRLVLPRASGQYTDNWERAPTMTKSLLQSIRLNPVSDPKPASVFVPHPRASTHFPEANDEYVLCRLEEGANLLREARELMTDRGPTACFYREEVIGRPGSWFPVQTPKDDALMLATIKKRLVKGSTDRNWKYYHDEAWIGELLYTKYCELHGWNPDATIPFDEELFLECISENETVKLTKKTEQMLANNEYRSDPDRPVNLVSHFLKSQLKGKMEAFLMPAKPGQTIATCHDLVLILLGAMNRYIRRVEHRDRPKNIFLHCGTSNEDLRDWTIEHWKDIRSTTNDYTAFDSSQKGESVAFAERHQARFSIPKHLSEFYVSWKVGAYSDIIGEKDLGRDTGEPGTYDDNCRYNLAVIACQYIVPRGLPILIGGDDSALNARLRKSPFWLFFEKHLRIVSKTEETDRPQFCSWYVTSAGVFKDPKLMMLKLMYHAALGDLDKVTESYAHEVSEGYRLGDTLVDYCDFDDLLCLGYLLRFFHRHLDGSVTKLLFSDLVFTEGLSGLLSYAVSLLESDTVRGKRAQKELEALVARLRRRLSGTFD